MVVLVLVVVVDLVISAHADRKSQVGALPDWWAIKSKRADIALVRAYHGRPELMGL